MTSRLPWILFGLSAAVNAFVLAGFVWNAWVKPPTIAPMQGMNAGVHLTPGARPPLPPLEAMMRDLELDEQQRARFLAIADSRSPNRRERGRELSTLRQQAVAELKQTQPSYQKIDAILERSAQLRVESQKENLRVVSEMSGYLRDDQRERLQASMADRLLGFGPGPGSRGPGPGGPGGQRSPPPRPQQQ